MKIKSFLLTTFLLLTNLSLLFAQQNITGSVSDGESPLPGATIIVDGTNNGTTTDFDGVFTISAQDGDVLIISYVGFADQRLIVGQVDSYDVILESANELEEVIVTSFGIAKKESFT